MKNKIISSILLAVAVCTGCSSDVKRKDYIVKPNDSTQEPTAPVDTKNSTDFGISLSSNNQLLNEGSSVTLTVQIDRSNGNNQAVNLAVSGIPNGSTEKLSAQFSQTVVPGNQTSANLTFSFDYSTLPIQRQVRSLQILGTANNKTIAENLRLEIAPTTRPDVYLLVGQSNMVGSSEDNAKQFLAGQADAPNDRIKQLNVTGNDQVNFSKAADFTNINNIASPSLRLTPAVDPLHTGYNTNINGKAGKRVGLGLSFAKRAINDTSASIYLVPAAWSDSGFCKRNRASLAGVLGWNAQPMNNPAFSGTVLHDRAIARANLALQETGGILRGILWHQGEADSDNIECANLYAENISKLVESLRSNINQDARGSIARGANANIPFVVGTMSKGPPYNDQSAPKQIVDAVHRNITATVPFSAFVNNDDLVPPAFPCGAGDCIHFGASAYREMGSRYYDFLRNAANQ